MTQFLPPNLLALFAARDPIPYLPPVDKLPHEKDSKPYSGVATFVQSFEDPKDTPAPTRVETKEERKERKRKERAEQTAYKLEQDLAMWDPSNDDNIHGDPFKTLFVARINYDTSESKLRREFEQYGSIRRIHMVANRNSNKPRGYAFIEYNHERDMHSAYKHADGKKIENRRVLVDVERGRTVKGWRPRRLGGGLGSTRKGGVEENSKCSGRVVDDGSRLFEERERREPSRERRSRRSRSKERRRSRERRVKKEEGSARKRSRRSRSRDRSHRSRSRDRKHSKRSSSRSQVKKEKVKKEEPITDGYGDYEGDYNSNVKQERDNQADYYNEMYNQMPPLPSGDRAN